MKTHQVCLHLMGLNLPIKKFDSLDRFGPAITPTSPKRTRDTTPTIVAERLPPPKAKVKNDK